MINISLSVMMLLYLVTARPFNTTGINFIEIFNELILLMGAGMLLELTDYDYNPERKVNVGNIIVALMTISIAMNTLFFIAELVNPLINNIKQSL